MADDQKFTVEDVNVSGNYGLEYIDLDEKRRAALAEIDNAKFGWYHVRACIVAGIGFFTDSYDLFAINIASLVIGVVYFNGSTPNALDLSMKVGASAGTMVGQVLFGWLADRLGRKRMYGIELMIIIVATFGQALAGQSPTTSVVGVITCWRVILGVGVGGDYPLSAIITSEFATTKRRGAMMAAVFAMQGFGVLAGSIVALVSLVGWHDQIYQNPLNADYVWRVLIGVGAIPGLIALYYRLTIPETPRYTMDVEQKITKGFKDANSFLTKGTYAGNYDDTDLIEQAEVPRATFRDFRIYFSKWENFKVLFGCAFTWFALDIAVYGIGLNNSFILKNISLGSVKGSSADAYYVSLYNASLGNFVISLLGTVPGYWITVFTIERLGRKFIQLMGFAALTVLYLVLGLAFHQIQNVSAALFIIIFTLSQLFQNFGPNATTFIVPGEVFPTRYRSTGHGISAASGKFGAIVAQAGFSFMKDLTGTTGSGAFIPWLIVICGCFMFLGFLATFLIPETTGLSLEQLSNENQTEFVRTKRGKATA